MRLKTPWRDGTSHVLMEGRELIERLVPLIPPPRAHQLRYHGILAPCASWRDRVVPAGDASGAVASCEPAFETEPSTASRRASDPRSAPATSHGNASGAETSRARNDARAPDLPPAVAAAEVESRASTPNRGARPRRRWAELLQRVFDIAALRCPRCGSTLRLIAAIEDPDIARRILECLDLPA